jgi:hypothetical protein
VDDLQRLGYIEAIRAVAQRYCRGVDRLDPDEMRSAYWPDAIDEHGVFVGNAWEFVDHCMVSHRKWRGTMHCIFNHHIVIDDVDHARGELYNVTYLFGHDGHEVSTWYGRYLDRYERRGDEWRISHRICVHEANRTESTASMPIAAERFRQGEVDRDTPGRAVGT